jgi:predicted metal-dependent HD superfamily phosphohydrolase
VTSAGLSDLHARWLTDIAAGAQTRADPALLEEAGAQLIARWNEPHRRYHNAAHLRAVLDGVDDLGDEAEQVAVVRLAVWFHDAVYQGEPGADEEASAVLAEQVLPPLGWAPGLVQEVARLVRLTADHAGIAGDDRNAAVLADADLAILAAPEASYQAYASAVRQEYAQVPDDAFAAGRTYVLTRLVENPPLYRTAAAQRGWTDAALANLRRELASLCP